MSYNVRKLLFALFLRLKSCLIYSHSTLELSFYIDFVWTLFIKNIEFKSITVYVTPICP